VEWGRRLAWSRIFLGIEHFADDIVENLLGYGAEERISGDLPGVEVDLGRLRVLITCTFKVRHQPVVIHRIAVEATPQLIVHPAPGHRFERLGDHLQGVPVAGAAAVAQQELQRHRLGELGGTRPAAVGPVETLSEAANGGREDVSIQFPTAQEAGA
jgi:hypothetical protein